MPRQSTTEKEAGGKIQLYASRGFVADVEEYRAARESELQSNVGPTMKHSVSAYVVSIVHKFMEAKAAYDKHNPNGGWNGFWETVMHAVVKKKGRR